MTDQKIESALQSLLEYCSNQGWQGCDPYDGLNSKILKATPLNQSKVARLILTQFCKRSPINIRRFLLVEKGQNPKGLGLFLSALLQLYSVQITEEYKEFLHEIIQLLKGNYSRRYSGYCWGYNFDWQSRMFFVPRGTPNAVCTTFIANAFLDAYEVLGDEEFAAISRSACDFITRDLNVASKKSGICFSYTPLDNQKVHNVNLLCAALLSRVSKLTGEQELSDYANKAVSLTASYQNQDGSWYYGTLPYQCWIDNFHTGFNLVALDEYIRFSQEEDFRQVLRNGFIYYKDNLFLADGTPKYFDHNVYPIDIHSVAQAIVTFTKLKALDNSNLDRAKQIALRAIESMQDKKGYFYFQKHRFYTNRIAYMRWSQAWMAYGLSLLFCEFNLGFTNERSTYSDDKAKSSLLFG